jgi:cytochrome P450 family 6
MTMALYELAYRHDIQEKLRIEIEEVVSRHDGKISYDAISEMTYLDQVINGMTGSFAHFRISMTFISALLETLRLYSPIGQLFRICAADYKVDGMNFTIEKGMPIIIPVHAIHHDSRYYYDPELFNPDRFSSEEVKKRPHYSFLPFGSGPRNCVGERFGLMQSKLGIATIIKNFRLSLHEETRYPLLMDCKNIVVTAFKPLMMNAERIL